MLILNRKVGEAIIINENITVKILDIVDGKVKIGIDAPKDINILRQEVYDSIIEENKKSINSSENVLDIIRGLNRN